MTLSVTAGIVDDKIVPEDSKLLPQYYFGLGVESLLLKLLDAPTPLLIPCCFFGYWSELDMADLTVKVSARHNTIFYLTRYPLFH